MFDTKSENLKSEINDARMWKHFTASRHKIYSLALEVALTGIENAEQVSEGRMIEL
jgi:hypothetical protein